MDEQERKQLVIWTRNALKEYRDETEEIKTDEYGIIHTKPHLSDGDKELTFARHKLKFEFFEKYGIESILSDYLWLAANVKQE